MGVLESVRRVCKNIVDISKISWWITRKYGLGNRDGYTAIDKRVDEDLLIIGEP